jgi:hypothetical protein
MFLGRAYQFPFATSRGDRFSSSLSGHDLLELAVLPLEFLEPRASSASCR